MTPLRALIVDDEPPARRRLRRLLTEIGDVEIVGEAGDSETMRAAVRHRRPDLVLLDIQMPGQSGIEVVAQLERPRPHVIFVTAHDAHAVRAFELHAIDYLLKPVSRARLADSLDRVRAARTAAGDARMESLRDWTRTSTPLARLPVTMAGRIQLVDVASIDWIESADNYVILHCGSRRHILRETMTRLMTRLDRRRFVRIHRSAILQIDRVDRLEPAGRGDWIVVLLSGARLAMSRTYRGELLSALQIAETKPL